MNHCLLVQPMKYGQITPPDSPTKAAGTPRDLKNQGLRSIVNSMFSELRRIKHVYSHPQALEQCQEFLAKSLPWAELHQTSSTAEAADVASTDHTGSNAAIASIVTAREMGLKVLLEDMQDVRENSTRFLILKRDPVDAPPWHSSLSHPKGERRTLLLSFAIEQQGNGNLIHSLGTFDKPNIRISNIHCRPSRKSPFHYVYFVEIEWRVDEEGRKQLHDALRDLGQSTSSRRCHGSWGRGSVEW